MPALCSLVPQDVRRKPAQSQPNRRWYDVVIPFFCTNVSLLETAEQNGSLS
jgi:hypothetical protein